MEEEDNEVNGHIRRVKRKEEGRREMKEEEEERKAHLKGEN